MGGLAQDHTRWRASPNKYLGTRAALSANVMRGLADGCKLTHTELRTLIFIKIINLKYEPGIKKQRKLGKHSDTVCVRVARRRANWIGLDGSVANSKFENMLDC